uniref:Uncharacterized protein n=1 Tax=Noctiluca scintillans TaxID=2966 RepID=A0A7S1A978_NOCSC|mmetsp:Transcript_36834/g.98070  ORF Transcript_36834/g.98070 Transcript_36834/m.98070 type:complete len:116 (+) Transcript_36834:320-667(+)
MTVLHPMSLDSGVLEWLLALAALPWSFFGRHARQAMFGANTCVFEECQTPADVVCRRWICGKADGGGVDQKWSTTASGSFTPRGPMRRWNGERRALSVVLPGRTRTVRLGIPKCA